jgi:outer membrane protein assembly factor BamB
VHCFSAAGLLKWKRPLNSSPSCEPVLSSEGGPLIALGDGSVLRVSPFGEVSIFYFDSAPKAIAVQGERTLVGFGDGSIQEILAGWASSGEFARLGSGIAALAADTSSVAYVLDNASAGMLDAGTGLNDWLGSVQKSRMSRLIIDERGLYVLGEKGTVAFARDGRRLWSLNMEGASLPATLSDEGILYSGGDDWILYAYRVEERVLADYSTMTSRKNKTYALAVMEEPDSIPDPFAMEEDNIGLRLDVVHDAILARDVGGLEKAFTLDLISIAGAEIPKLGKRGPIAVLPHQRARAAYALGDLGSSEVLPFLANLFRRDPETVVRSAAAEAIGAIGSDPDGLAMEAFAEAVFPPVPMRDERLLFSTASSIGALCRFSGPPLSDMGIRLLVSLSSPDRPSIVRSKAQRELTLMMAK